MTEPTPNEPNTPDPGAWKQGLSAELAANPLFADGTTIDDVARGYIASKAVAPAAGPEPTNFDKMREGLPADLRDHMGLKPFTSFEAIARSYVNIQGLMNTRVESLTPEQLGSISAAHGRPDTPEAYVLNKPEATEGLTYSDDLEAKYRGWAHGRGLNQSQAEGLYEDWNNFQSEIFNQVEAEIATKAQAAQTALRSEFGAAYPRKEKAAQAAIDKFGGENYAIALEQSGDGNNPAVIRAWMNVAEAIGEDTLIGGATPTGLSVTVDQAKARVPQLMAEKAYFDVKDPAHAVKVKEVTDLFKIAYPEE